MFSLCNQQLQDELGPVGSGLGLRLGIRDYIEVGKERGNYTPLAQSPENDKPQHI